MNSVFVSYNQADRAWAEWIAWRLEEAGHAAVIQAWDFRPGSNFMLGMQAATSQAELTIAVLSPNYLCSPFTQAEWAAALAVDPTGQQHRLIPVRVRDCEVDGLLSQIVWIDLVGLPDEELAARALLDGLHAARVKPPLCPPFPAAHARSVPVKPQFPIAQAVLQPAVTEVLPDRPGDPWLLILTELLTLPKVQKAVVAFQLDCDAMCDQIDHLMNYKDLHDQLHQLQFYCYDPIVGALKTRTIDEETLAVLVVYEMNLQGIIDNLREIARRFVSGSPVATWIQTLADARTQLEDAIEHADADALQQAMTGIRRVLERQPARINERIIESAHELHLSSVVEALTKVCDRLTDRDIDPEKVDIFKSGLRDLNRLSDDLNAMRDNHAQWQEVDVELRIIDVGLDHSADDLLESWPHLRKMTDPLCGSGDDWAVRLRADCERLERAISLPDKAATLLFRSFRRRAGLQFFKVDTDMKRVCEQVRRTGLPLASTLRVIQ